VSQRGKASSGGTHSAEHALNSARGLVGAGKYFDALRLLQTLELPPSAPPTSHSIKLELTLVALHGLGDWTALGEMGRESLQLLRESGDHRLRALVHGHLGVALMRSGSIKAAEEHFRAAIHIAIWDAEARALAVPHRRRLAVMFQTLGRWSQSLHETRYAIEEARELGLTDQELAALTVSAVVAWKSGRLDEMLSSLERMEALSESGKRPGVAERVAVLRRR